MTTDKEVMILEINSLIATKFSIKEFSFEEQLAKIKECNDDYGTNFTDEELKELIDKENRKGYAVEKWDIEHKKRQQKKEEEKYKEDETQAEEIVRLSQQDNLLFHDQYQEPHAAININGHREIHSLKSKFFKRWLSHQFYQKCGKIPNTNSITSASKVLEAKACFEGERISLHNRVAWYKDSIYCDLTDKEWRAIKISKEGWEIIPEPPILFRRYSHQKPQVLPKEEGNVHSLLNFMNMKNEADKQLIEVQTVTSLIPDIPHPIPISHGSQGSSKSTIFKILRKIIDPSEIELLSYPNDERELVQKLSHHWCAYFDNVTKLPGWLSDSFCRAVTGDGFSKRELYSDDDDIIYSYKRCIGINGINVPATKPDLLDRSILFKLERISKTKRKDEQLFWSQFNEKLPEILSGVFSTLSKAMKIKESINLGNLPRMADFAIWGEAISRALGYPENSFIQNYFENISVQNVEAIEGHAIGGSILELMTDNSSWEGTATELLQKLNEIAEKLKLNIKDKDWPKAPNSLTRRLNEIKSNLEDENIHITLNRGGKKGIRSISISKCDVSKKPSESSELTLTDYTNDYTDSSDDDIPILNTLEESSTEKLTNEIKLFIGDGRSLKECVEKFGEDEIQKRIDNGELYENPKGILHVLK